jgi:hypothetical protein
MGIGGFQHGQCSPGFSSGGGSSVAGPGSAMITIGAAELMGLSTQS